MAEGLRDIDKSIIGDGFVYTRLDLSKQLISSLGKVINKFPSLINIDLSQNHLKNLNGISHVENLLYLKVDKNVLESLPLFSQQHFQILIASHNRIPNLKKTGSETLEKIDLDYNLLKDLDGLDKFPNLKSATLRHNNIKSTKKCGLMTELRSLNLDYNDITKLPDIENLTVLEDLSLNCNPDLSSVNELTSLENLTNLSLDCTAIEKCKDIELLSQLSTLTSLSLVSTPLSSIENYRQEVLISIPQLKTLDGDEISFEERKEAKRIRLERIKEKENAPQETGEEEEENDD